MERALSLSALALTVLMMMLGAVVHGTGSSLACPDWPLCYGDAFPPMQGGVLFEHSHRLLGTLIGVVIVSLVVVVLRKRAAGAPRQLLGAALGLIIAHAILAGVGVSKSIWPLAIVGFLLDVPLVVVLLRLGKVDASIAAVLAVLQMVITQGFLGGLTVVLKLPVIVSAGHLSLSMILLSVLAALAVHFSAETGPRVEIARKRLGALIVVLFLQIVLGAFIKHTGSSLACGIDVILCNGGAPHGGPAHLHYTHRILGLIVFAGVIAETLPILRAAKRAGNRRVRLFSVLAHVIVLLQVILGIGTIQTYVSVPMAALHLGNGALLLADLVALFTMLGAQRATGTEPATATELAHAT